MQRHSAIFGAAIGGGLFGFLLGGAASPAAHKADPDSLAQALVPAARWTSAPYAPASLDLTLTEMTIDPPAWAIKPSRFAE